MNSGVTLSTMSGYRYRSALKDYYNKQNVPLPNGFGTDATVTYQVKAFKNKIGALRALHIVQKFDKLVETADESDKETFASQVNKLLEVSLLQAMEWAKEAWQSVTQDTIANRWCHTGILDEEMYELFESMNYL
ncbi:hypothetical protein B5M09_011189 [Aphanomyces astaci]|uniref:DDE-1 domain-containing protein n=1 Tax=Aphanomyces astaci TaxID=112090 RepID=A0A425CRS9_APHAT|nr:hypothetical protein B5M09_011189 [Aphanomyces astaci]